jgi:hypothetical protein
VFCPAGIRAHAGGMVNHPTTNQRFAGAQGFAYNHYGLCYNHQPETVLQTLAGNKTLVG